MDPSPRALSDHWSQLTEPWRLAFTQAWEAFQAGNVAVGAVVVDPAGAVVSAARNRQRDATAPERELAGTNLAHAELNVLARLPRGGYPDHTLLTTLEPCLLCSAALRLCHVGTVEYAAADPIWAGVAKIPELSGQLARHWPARVGPWTGPLGRWAALLPLVTYAEQGASGPVRDGYAAAEPELTALAARLAADPARLAMLRTASLPGGFDLLDGSV